MARGPRIDETWISEDWKHELKGFEVGLGVPKLATVTLKFEVLNYIQTACILHG